ncbi:spore gernimation protein [Bacillus salipaludis]|uniref:Spore germination protein GerPB n=1 Tax=Bacillus salipaludis TaxID=2547811 RepID=A0A4R5VLG3_9BACI|nr:spore germination protein GerPB [Bacillus salipaludis]MDQ6599233.1 spore germination protein GerPB [Bacillus salipaludis]TDK58877.1 spore gernimation protein [Bacillus salipaludis]
MDFKTRVGIKINFLKITEMVNTAVLQIGSSGPIKRSAVLPEWYQIHPPVAPGIISAAVPLAAPVREKTTELLAPAVPLQAPVPEKGNMNK